MGSKFIQVLADGYISLPNKLLPLQLAGSAFAESLRALRDIAVLGERAFTSRVNLHGTDSRPRSEDAGLAWGGQRRPRWRGGRTSS